MGREMHRSPEGLLQEAEDLVPPRRGLHEIGVRPYVVDQPLLMLAHAEEVVLLRDLGDGPLAVGAGPLLEVLFGPEALVGDTVPSVVRVLVDLAPVVQVLEDSLDNPDVALLGGADEVIVGDAELLPEFLKADHHTVAVFLRSDAGRRGRLFHLLPVLVDAGEEEDLLSPEPVKARQAVGDDGGVGVPEVGDVVYVVDRRRDVKVLSFGHVFWPLKTNNFT